MTGVKEKEERWIKHYSSGHKILLVGEGDFSFSACLARAFRSAVNMVSSSLHSQGELYYTYKHYIICSLHSHFPTRLYIFTNKARLVS